MGPPFYADGNSLDYFEQQLAGSAANEVRVLLITAIENGTILAPFPIKAEYERKSDPPLFLDDPELKMIFQNSKSAEVSDRMVEIIVEHPKTRRRSAKTRIDPGDPWLVANACVNSGTVVTEENPSATGSNGKDASGLKKLPDICDHQSVSWTNGAGFLDWCRANFNI